MLCPACGQETPEGFKFCANCGAPLTEGPAQREVRKVVTVVFCDLTGSTALGDATDPEALRATMRGYYDEMRTILERHGGTVEKFIGDAVMAVFGIPVSFEDDALRAVRAAWQMRAAVPELGLRARIGVNTGEVVAGSGDSLVTGDAVNVAARLEQAAGPGEVLIGSETRRLVRGAVQVEPLTIEAKGKGTVGAFRLVHVDPEAEAIARRLDTPLVGRRSELRHLHEAFERTVRERRCHLFTLLGTAGVGKSRLVSEFLASVDARVLEGRCLDYGEGITYWPVVSILKQLGGEGGAALQRVIEGGTMPNELPWSVRTTLEGAAAEQPLIVVFDDIQWGEETFLDLVDHIADLSRGAPILLLCVARPELLDKRPGWGGGKLNATTVLLEPLTSGDCIELIRIHGGVEDDVVARILAAADGNPLFLEEMVALVREDGDVGIPSTVHALLQARLDQLAADERAVMERGAVEGQLFHRAAVAELARPAEVDPQLIGLVRKELIQPAPATLTGEQAFRFRHLLIRDAAYDALPKTTRAELHERFADWLVAHSQDLVELDEIAGYHLEQATRYCAEVARPRPDLAERAAHRLAAAGRRAAARMDVAAALKLLGRAAGLYGEGSSEWESVVLDRLAVLRNTPGDELRETLARLERSDDPRLRMHARLEQLGLGVDSAVETATEEAPAAVAEARALFGPLGDDRGLAAAAALEASLAWLRSHAADTVAAVDRFALHAGRAGIVSFGGRFDLLMLGPFAWGPFTPDEMRARVAGYPADALQRRAIEGMIAEREGRYEDALAWSRATAARYSELGLLAILPAPMSATAGQLRKLGRLEESVRAYEEVIALHESLGQTGYLSTTSIELGETMYDLGDFDEAERLAVEAEQMGGPDDVINFSRGRALRAVIAADRGFDDQALELAHSAREYAFRTDFPGEHGRAHEALGHVHRRAGRLTDARSQYEHALIVWERYGFAASAAEARRLLEEL
jgi:class 3 adenylate cyclase/tetratricopeptide (TPR) repeat protein